jgi:glucose-6-phosphate dehydrogenase assembly protein OpcA
MSNYTKATDFATKDTLASGNPAKIIKGTEINTEFVNVQTAVNSKMDATIAAFNTTIAGGTINQGTIDGGTY